MVNKSFEAYKITREIKRSGSPYTFFRKSVNEFGEPDEEETEIGTLNGIYHEQNSNVQITTGDTTQIRTKKIPMILCLYNDARSLDLKLGDKLYINEKTFTVSSLVNIQEWNIIGDISLEEVAENVSVS